MQYAIGLLYGGYLLRIETIVGLRGHDHDLFAFVIHDLQHISGKARCLFLADVKDLSSIADRPEPAVFGLLKGLNEQKSLIA